MHFWIDKRSQCAYASRHRLPSSLSAGVGRPRGRVGVGARKGMAAPVHRFTAVECRPHRPLRHYSGPPVGAVHPPRRQPEEPSLYVEIPPEPPQPTIASLAAARSVTPDTLLRTAALGLHHTPMIASHLKFGILVSFGLATIFLAGAKYYFDRKVVRDNSTGGEASAVCAVVAALAGMGCALSLCRARPNAPPLPPPERVSSTARRHRAQETIDEVSSSGSLLQPTERSPVIARPAQAGDVTEASGVAEEAPPPYHIAVLLEASPPPPAYSALS
ncbi:hypothetical protein EVAR_37208_1 [Eumeta japonica]|uniref:Uncharacterized protein n=1 Tax=Eumeta variegata TaxID=151549 RepID=A0A4C1Z1H8_EUMVA|nr:hypothetical protein EVAR_37208_1 [Eumeta japonica]